MIFSTEPVYPSNPIRHTDVSFHHALLSSYYIYTARGLSLYLTSLQVIDGGIIRSVDFRTLDM